MPIQAFFCVGRTKSEELHNFMHFFRFFRPTQKMGPDGPKWGQEDFFLLIQTLPTFWAERILILRIFIFWIFWVPNFWLGPTWAKLGPTHLGPAWAHPLGPLGWAGGPSGGPSAITGVCEKNN